MQFDWYAVPDGDAPLEQGDILEQIEVPLAEGPPDEDGNVAAKLATMNAIVISQSCDLAKAQFTRVALCPVFDLNFFKERGPETDPEGLRRGKYVSYHLLNRSELEGFERDFRVVDFRTIHQMAKAVLQDAAAAGQRIRLLPPYREHLAQAFARSFMRVGLPIDIPRFK